MKATVKTRDLKKALSVAVRLQKRVTRTHPILADVILSISGGQMTLKQNVLDAYYEEVIPVCSESDGTVLVNAEALKRAVADMGEAVNLYTEDGNLMIANGEAQLSLCVEDMADYPLWEATPEIAKIDMPARLFGELYAMVQQAPRLDKARTALYGTHIDVRGGLLTLVKTDGHSLAYVVWRGVKEGVEMELLIPEQLAPIVKDMAKSGNGISIVKCEPGKFPRAGIKTSTKTLFYKHTDERYPNYRMVVPKDNIYRWTFRVKGFSDQIKKMQPALNSMTQLLRINIGAGGKAELSGGDYSLRSGKASFDFQVVSEPEKPFCAGYRADYLIRILGSFGTMLGELSVKNSQCSTVLRPLSPVLPYDGQVEEVGYLLMPLRLPDYED